MKFSLRTIIWSTLVLAIGAAIVFSVIPKPVEVEVAEVGEGTLEVTVLEDGITRIREKYIVSSPVAGKLSRIQFRPGDDVTAEESLLAIILPTPPAILDARSQAQAEARVMAAQASVSRAKANLEKAKIGQGLAKTKMDRAEELFQENGISANEFETAEANFLAGEQAVKSASFESEIATFELSMAQAAAKHYLKNDPKKPTEPFEIRAPISGKILRLFQESSTVVTSGMPLLELGNQENLEIIVDVLSTDAVKINAGARILIEHWGGDDALQAQVRTVEPAASTKVSSLGVEEQRVNVIADFSETPERLSRLGDGYRVEARIMITEKENVVQIPNSALFRNDSQWSVFKVESGKARLHEVAIGIQNQEFTEVTQGLGKGDSVIVFPNDQIKDGTSIIPAE